MPSEQIMTDSVEALRHRLMTREKSLATLRKKVDMAKAEAQKPKAKSSISAIQQRYMAAVADLESKGKDASAPVMVGASAAPVSSLATRWNKGMEGKKIEKTRIHVRGDVSGAKKNFGKMDSLRSFGSADGTGKKSKRPEDYGPAELEVEDEDAGVPSWAVNQKRKTIKKENARSSVRDVDVKDLQGSVLEQAARDGSEASGERVKVGGNVKAALAMWGKTADEDTLLLKKKKEEEEKRKALEAKLRKEKEEEERKKKLEDAIARFSKLSLKDLGDEPEDELELIVYLERKIELIEEDITKAENELDALESAGDS